MLHERELARALRYGHDPVAFCREVLDFHPDAWQARILVELGTGTRKRGIVCGSRQIGKSECTAALATYTAAMLPGALILVVSPSERQSLEFFKKVQAHATRLSRSDLATESKHELQLANGSIIRALPGTEATIRGFSAVDLVIEDEAARVNDDLFAAVCPMLAVSGGRLLLISTPAGKRRHHFVDAWFDGDPDWLRIEVTALQVARIGAADGLTPAEFVEKERRRLGDRKARAEFLCEFVAAEGQVISEDAIERARAPEVEPLDISDVPAPREPSWANGLDF